MLFENPTEENTMKKATKKDGAKVYIAAEMLGTLT